MRSKSPDEMLVEIEQAGEKVIFDKVPYFFATANSGEQGEGFSREDALTSLYRNIKASKSMKPCATSGGEKR